MVWVLGIILGYVHPRQELARVSSLWLAFMFPVTPGVATGVCGKCSHPCRRVGSESGWGHWLRVAVGAQGSRMALGWGAERKGSLQALVWVGLGMGPVAAEVGGCL